MLDIVNKGALLYIGGEWVSGSGGTEAVINPANERVIGHAPLGSAADAEAAIAAAREAFDTGLWPRLPARERQAKMTAFLAAIERRKEEIIALTVAEAGAPQVLARFLHYETPMKHARATVELATRDPVTAHAPEVTPQADGTKTLGMALMVRQPIGVVGAITAYNFPFFLNLAKVIPSLAVGCTVVLKPSPYTPFAALLFGEIAEEVGLPPGVLNIVNGGAEVGERLTTDARVDLVTFTGSDVVGAKIQAQAAPTLKRVIMELGGKSALIVRPDADLRAAVACGLVNFTTQCGQGCGLLTRHIVHNSIRAQYVEALAAIARQVKVGDPADPATGMGPLIREAARTRTEQLVASAQDEGARLVAGGKRPSDLDKGFYFEPTLFDDVKNHFRIARQEVFGPVGVVIGYDDDDEAIGIANDSDYGLGGGVFSADAGKAYEMALRLHTGNVSINGGAGAMSSHAPFGGVRRSGYGLEYGLQGLNEFTYAKTVSFHGG